MLAILFNRRILRLLAAVPSQEEDALAPFVGFLAFFAHGSAFSAAVRPRFLGEAFFAFFFSMVLFSFSAFFCAFTAFFASASAFLTAFFAPFSSGIASAG